MPSVELLSGTIGGHLNSLTRELAASASIGRAPVWGFGYQYRPTPVKFPHARIIHAGMIVRCPFGRLGEFDDEGTDDERTGDGRIAFRA